MRDWQSRLYTEVTSRNIEWYTLNIICQTRNTLYNLSTFTSALLNRGSRSGVKYMLTVCCIIWNTCVSNLLLVNGER